MDKVELKKMRIMMGITQSNFARKIGITQSVFSKLESGKTTIVRFENRIMTFYFSWRLPRIEKLIEQVDRLLEKQDSILNVIRLDLMPKTESQNKEKLPF